jgi:RNA polymerase sigma factor (sigma-70 family)
VGREEPAESDPADVASLAPLIRRVVGRRLQGSQSVDDVVQETLARVLTARGRLNEDELAPYAVVTARNLVATLWQTEDRRRRHNHRLVQVDSPVPPDEQVVLGEESSTVNRALAQLSPRDRELLVAHEVEGADTAALARRWSLTRAAVAAQLARARAKLRVEYLVALEGVELPTTRCRPVLEALSASDRRRQRELNARDHLLRCPVCARLAELLFQHRPASRPPDTTARIERDADVVAARRLGRDLARQLGFSATDLTIIATAISEIARNIVRFAERGELVMSVVEESGKRGLQIVARDAGPGIADLQLAQRDGYSTYGGMGLGLPGCRRLMDEFEITSEIGKGTTVTMTKWRPPRADPS